MSESRPLRAPLSRILSPSAVAVIGASEDTGKFGGRVLHHLIKHGYGGRIAPVNPKRASLFGIRTYASIAGAGPVDAAVIAVPPQQVVETVEACAAAEVAACVIITAQMAEIGGEGKVRERRIVDIARGSGMRIIGPNCLGIVDAHLRLALTASFAMGVDRLPAGGLAIVSQSGALMATMFNAGYDHGTGFSKLVSIGNQADVTECDVLEVLIDDPQTQGIVHYVEGFSDAARFLDLAAAARRRGKPVAVVKAGRSEAGRATAFSHTASMTGPFRLFEAAARARGIVISDDTEASIAVADALIRWPAGLPAASGVALASGSGGGAGMLADRLTAAGLPLAEVTPETTAALVPLLPAGQPCLPLDAGALKAPETLGTALRALAADPGTGALVYLMTTQPAMAETAEALAAIEHQVSKPVIPVLTAGSVASSLRTSLRDRGVLFCDRIDDAARVLQGLRDHAAPMRAVPPDVPAALRTALPTNAQPGPADSAQCAALAAAAGISVAVAEVVTSARDAVAAARRIGFPVVLKAVGAGIVHKLDRGGVKVGIADADSVASTFADLASTFRSELAGVLVQRQHAGVAEMIVGSLYDSELGTFVMVGSGGIHAELLDDTAVAPAPLTPEEARALVLSLRLAPLLTGSRGRPLADLDSVAVALVGIGNLAAALGPRLPEMEINPLIVGPQAAGSIAVDIRARLA